MLSDIVQYWFSWVVSKATLTMAMILISVLCFGWLWSQAHSQHLLS